MLRDVSAAVRRSLRHGDVAGRYDADRLLAVAADADGASASALAARIGGAVRSAAGSDGLGLAIGIAIYPDDALTAGDLLAEAGRALDDLVPGDGVRLVHAGYAAAPDEASDRAGPRIALVAPGTVPD